MGLQLVTVTPDNVAAACRLAVRPEQEDVVAPVAFSLAEAYASPGTAWPRLVVDTDVVDDATQQPRVVGFVMGGFDPGNPMEEFRCGVWRGELDLTTAEL